MDSLFYVLNSAYQMTGIPVRAYDSTGKITLFSKGYTPEQDPLNAGEVREQLCAKAKGHDKPFVELEEDICGYGVLRDTTDCVLVVGPIMLGNMSSQEIHAYARRHRVADSGFTMAAGSLLVLFATLAMLYFARTGQQLPDSVLLTSFNNPEEVVTYIDESDVNQYVMQSVDEEIKHTDYSVEFLYLKQIREGDVESIKREVDPNFNLNSIGRMANKSLKHFEYMICSSITLATRAAIDGGLDPTTAYALSDLYMQRLEQCTSAGDFIALQLELKMAYAKQVKKARENRSKTSYIERCKIFIANHLNKPFELDELAAELGINKAYLARKFKEEMGMGIMQYTRMKRVETAANMLKFSNEPISTIANYLCFPTQSHFGAVFKELKGISPQRYRDREQVLEVKNR